MNLVLSGPISPPLIALIEQVSRPSVLTPLGPFAWRLERVDDSPPTRRTVAACCASAAVDHAYVETQVRFSDMKLLALDMDSTLITIECIDELADFAGKKAEVASITEATMRGEIKDFAESLRRRVSLLQGLDAFVLRRVYDERLHLSPGAETLIDAAHKNGLHLLLVSGGFTYFADRLKQALRFDDAFANHLETIAGKLTGRVVGPIIDGPAKAAHVKRAMHLTGCTTAEVIVIGDGANDIPMMGYADYSIAYHAKSVVEDAAKVSIRHGTLRTVLDFFN